jgi:hypothetical protein
VAVHSLTVKQILSRVRQVFPDAPETYVMSLINDGLLELASYDTKVAHAKITTAANQMWYDLSDSASSSDGSSYKLEINKVNKVYLMDSDGDYIQIPRLTNDNLLLTDITSESALNAPDTT